MKVHFLKRITWHRSLPPTLLPLTLFIYCNSQIQVNNIDKQPVPSKADSIHANVYKPLDGTWRGRFHIYERTAKGALPAGLAKARPIIRGDWEPAPLVRAGVLRLKQSIDVEQVYTSETPYFQRVRIRDTYTDAKGKKRVVESRGVNKIQDGIMWCVVRKPHETVIHKGGTEGKDVIIWQRDVQSPRRIEYFHEAVRANSYTIKGWGYYTGHDPAKPPHLWFLGEYKRVR